MFSSTLLQTALFPVSNLPLQEKPEGNPLKILCSFMICDDRPLSPPVGRLLLRIQWKIYIWKEAPENTSSSDQKLHTSLSVQSSPSPQMFPSASLYYTVLRPPHLWPLSCRNRSYIALSEQYKCPALPSSSVSSHAQRCRRLMRHQTQCPALYHLQCSITSTTRLKRPYYCLFTLRGSKHPK